MTNQINLDQVETATHIITLLTTDRKVDVDVIFPDDESQAPLIEIATTNMSYGRINGGGGKTITDLRVMMRALLEGASVILKVGNDATRPNEDVSPIPTIDLLKNFIHHCDSLVGVDVNHSSNIAILTPLPGQQIDGELKVAIERVFFAVSRAQNERLPIRWS